MLRIQIRFTLALLAALSTSLCAQESAPVVPGMCKPWLDSLKTTVTVAEVAQWADQVPIRVGCDDGKVYTLHRYDISIFTRKPLQTREYGTGEEGGIPILARKAIDQCSKGDAFILKNVVYLDAEGQEQMLPVISIQLD